MSASAAPERTPHLATLVVGNAVTKLDALTVVALAINSGVENAGTSRPFIRLSDQAWAEIDIPKFGEPPPLAIDIYSDVDLADARREALRLSDALTDSTRWVVTPKFEL